MTKGPSALPRHDSPPSPFSAPAKINLILRILDRRPDGYHNLWSIMQTVALEDAVTMRIQFLAGRRDPTDLRCRQTLAVDHTNLVYEGGVSGS